MNLDNAKIVTIVSAVITILALFWAVYAYFSTRKVSKLTYDMFQLSAFSFQLSAFSFQLSAFSFQLSAFGVPESFIKDMPHSPIAVKVTSRGDKSIEDIVLRLKINGLIESFEVYPPSFLVVNEQNEIGVQADRLNPSQKIKIFIRCHGNPTINQIENVDLTHYEGAGIREGDVQALSIPFMGIELAYNPIKLTSSLMLLGPVSFR